MRDKSDRTRYLGVNHGALVCRDMAETTDFAFDDERDVQCEPLDAQGKPVDSLRERLRRLEPAE